MDVTYGSRAMLGYPYITSMYPTGHSSMVLDPFMYPIRHPSMGLEPSRTFMYPTMHLRWVKDPYVKTIFWA
jgi:hypothetical protein